MTVPARITIDAEAVAAWLANDFPREYSDKHLHTLWDWLHARYCDAGSLPEPDMTLLRAYGAEIDRRLALRREA